MRSVENFFKLTKAACWEHNRTICIKQIYSFIRRNKNWILANENIMWHDFACNNKRQIEWTEWRAVYISSTMLSVSHRVLRRSAVYSICQPVKFKISKSFYLYLFKSATIDWLIDLHVTCGSRARGSVVSIGVGGGGRGNGPVRSS